MTKKKVLFYVVEAVVLLIIAFLIFYFIRMGDRDKIIAEEFLKEYYTVEVSETLWNEQSGSDRTGITEAFGEWFTPDALADAILSEDFLVPDKAAALNSFSVACKSVGFTEDADESEDIASYMYSAQITITFDNGDTQTIDTEGMIVLIKTDGDWMINEFIPDDEVLDPYIGCTNIQAGAVCQ